MKRIRRSTKGVVKGLPRKGRAIIAAIEKLLDLLFGRLWDRLDRIERELERVSADMGRMEDRITSRVEMRVIRSVEGAEKRILHALDAPSDNEE